MPWATTTTRQAAAKSRAFLPVSVKALLMIQTTGLDLYIPRADGQAPQLWRDARFEISDADLRRLMEAGHQTLYIRNGDDECYQEMLQASLERIVCDETLPLTDRFMVMQTAVVGEVEQALQMIEPAHLVDASHKVSRHVVSLLAGSRTMPRDLFGVLRHDFCTFTHVINVSSYCVLLAERLGIRDEKQLHRIGAAGILHDIGKRKVPQSILNKKERLTDSEWGIIRKHPTIGYQDLVGRPEVDFDQLMMVYQHHEKLDGSGYPVGITSAEIHPWARLCAVVDIFDALTGRRPYRKAVPPDAALEHLDRLRGSHLDEEMVSCWIDAMGSR